MDYAQAFGMHPEDVEAMPARDLDEWQLYRIDAMKVYGGWLDAHLAHIRALLTAFVCNKPSRQKDFMQFQHEEERKPLNIVGLPPKTEKMLWQMVMGPAQPPSQKLLETSNGESRNTGGPPQG